MASREDQLQDKCRILATCVGDLVGNMLAASCRDRNANMYGARPNFDKKPVVGDLVLCATSGRIQYHDWVIGWVKEIHESHEFLIREIGSNRLCRISNERFYVIEGLSELKKLEGDQYRFYIKVVTAMSKYGDGWRLFSNIKFHEDQVTVSLREKLNGLQRDKVQVPFEITFKWHPKMTYKKIALILEENGWFTKPFEYVEEQNGHSNS
jgi:hypothetical protein